LPTLANNDHYQGWVYTQVTIYDLDDLFCSVISKKDNALILIVGIILGALSIMYPTDIEGAEFRLQPGIGISEGYNDNIFLTPGNKSYDYITDIAPSVNIMYKVPLWDWDVSYLYDYRHYARYVDLNTRQNNSNYLNIVNRTRIKDEYMFLDIRDNYSRVSLDPTRDFTKESTFVNQTDRNILTVNPYFIIRPTSQMTLTTGYTYLNTWYKDPNAINTVDNTVYTGLQQDLSRRSIVTAGIRHSQGKNSIQDYTLDDVYLGQSFEYAENSTISVAAGNTWFQTKDAEKITQLTWDANVTHRYSTLTITYETGLRFIPDPYLVLRREDRYLATLRKDAERTSLMLSGGLIEYRDVKYKHLQNTDYRLSGVISHAVTTKSKMILSLTADRWDDNQTGTSTERYLTGVRFEHMPTEKLTLALDYRYTNVYSQYNYLEIYDNNRFTVEFRKVF
jgi:hypothetical protein